MKRRGLLRVLGAALVVVPAAYLARSRWWSTVAASPAARELIAYCGRDRESLRLGGTYAAGVGASAAPLAIPEDRPVDWLQARIAQDFREGRTLFVGGWVVAETEARLCAWLRRA
jgi:hypothetical protein